MGATETVVPPRPVGDFAAAVGFLTLLPVGREWPEGRRPRSVGWYPWVGWVLGAAGVLVGTAPVLWRSFLPDSDVTSTAPLAEPFVLAAVIVAAWAFLTRFLHWDGLADAFDGLLGGQTRERRLEIMRDSRIGSFGATALVMTALLQVCAVAAVIGSSRAWPLLAAPVLGRFAASLAAWTIPAARREGLGLTAIEQPGFYDLAVAVAAVGALAAAAIFADPLRGAAVLVVGIGAGLLVPRLLARPVGGMTGDLMGATVLLVETLVLLTGAVI